MQVVSQGEEQSDQIKEVLDTNHFSFRIQGMPEDRGGHRRPAGAVW